MAAKKSSGGAAKKSGGPVKKKKASRKLHKAYNVSGDSLTRKNKTCPKCGSGVFMAEHKDRHSCGKCGFMEKK